MKTELIENSSTQKEIKLEIDGDAVKEVYNRVSKKYAKSAQVPGFRKGFAPLDVVRMRYQNEIRQDVIQELIPVKVTEAIREHDLNPLAEPQLHLENAETVKLNGTEPVKLHVHLEIMPEIPDVEFKGLEATRRIKPVEKDEIDNIIDERRQQYATLIPVEDRGAHDGDTVIADLVGTFPDDPSAEPIAAENLEITLGDGMIEQSFTENLQGVKEDDVREFTVEYPEDFSSPALAGKTLNYKATVKSVGKMELPELDDEWVKSLDEGFDSVKDLKKSLEKDLDAAAKAQADQQVRNELIGKLAEKYPIEIPNSLIEMQARTLLNNFGQDLAQRGVDLSKVEKEFIEMAYTQMRGQAERDVRGAMLLEKVAELEGAEVSSEEIAAEIDQMASYYRVSPEEIRTSLSQQEGGEANIANSLRTRKAVEALFENAKIKDGEWIDESQPAIEAGGEKEKAPKKSAKPAKAKAEKPEKKAPAKDAKKKTAKKS
ncbi:MAG: trigger factor [Pyrinomonadaceae bacterium]|nr:trigger factor [Pyrinomonadaceae bacterium]